MNRSRRNRRKRTGWKMEVWWQSEEWHEDRERERRGRRLAGGRSKWGSGGRSQTHWQCGRVQLMAPNEVSQMRRRSPRWQERGPMLTNEDVNTFRHTCAHRHRHTHTHTRKKGEKHTHTGRQTLWHTRHTHTLKQDKKIKIKCGHLSKSWYTSTIDIIDHRH